MQIEIPDRPVHWTTGSHDGERYTWPLRVNRRVVKRTADFSGTLLAVFDGPGRANLPPETQDAIATKGRSVIEAFAAAGRVPTDDDLTFRTPVWR
jgi:hypothetical protein